MKKSLPFLDSISNEAVCAALKKILPAKLDPVNLEKQLPLFKFNLKKNELSLFLLAKKRRGLTKFVLEMWSKWVVPGLYLELDFFSKTNFTLKDSVYSLFEAKVAIEEPNWIDSIHIHLPILSHEIQFGASASYYQAMQILEMKGLSLSDKTIALQEDMAHLVQRYPGKIDSDIYPLMRLVMGACSERFKRVHSQRHLTKLVYMTYQLMGKLKQQRSQRFVGGHVFKFKSQASLQTEKKWTILFAVSLKSGNEVFELNHFISVVKEVIPSEIDEELSCQFEMKELGGQFFMVEVDEQPMAIYRIKNELKKKVGQSIQKMVRPVFMPRNEEEVLKNIVELSRQLKYVHDIPQVMINFDRQTENQIFFRVILARLIKEKTTPLDRLKDILMSKVEVSLERKRHAGILRKKISKEVSVWRVGFKLEGFLRGDNTLDLYKARYEAYRQFKEVFGEIRDFNGGLMAKQRERLEELKDKLKQSHHNSLFKDFFFSLYPVEYRTVWKEEEVLQFFHDYLKWLDGGGGSFKEVSANYSELDFDEKMHLKMERGELMVIGCF
ncbi:MAG: hypothetical protein P0S95_05005 [Rhabdochlamydiaceae bacterium]|nr:hypothetical protein [Candidatus Amphrikana amoebophyrae]